MKKLKHLYSIIIVSIFLSIAVGSDNPASGVKDASDLEGVMEEIDDAFDDFQDEYESLCEEKRNDQLKKKYMKLMGDIQSVIEAPWENENLSGREQNQGVEYAQKKLKKYKGLYKLAGGGGTIDCW